MKKRWKLILLSLNFAMILSLMAAVALLLPRQTKADNKKSLITIESTEASAQDNGEDEADVSQKGGSVYVDEGCVFELNSGMIANSSNTYGGAVYVASGGIFRMKGGIISGCNASYGGAVYVASGGTFEMTGGVIQENKAICAGAIYVEEGANCYISGLENGCSIKNNAAEIAPAIYDAGVSSVQNGVVTDNYKINYYEINFYADGIYVTSVTLDFSENDVEFDSEMVPDCFTIENTCGWFVDRNLTVTVNEGDKIKEYANAEDYENNRYIKPCFNRYGEVNLYTKFVNAEIFDFELNVGGVPGYSIKLKQGVTLEQNTNLVIPIQKDGIAVTAIASSDEERNGAFAYNNNITSVYLPASLSKIGKNAFIGCYNLTDINFPKDLACIDASAFESCKSLVDVLLNDGLKEIGKNAFFYCSKLGSVYLPENLQKLGDGAFSLARIENLYFNPNIENWGIGCFESSSINYLEFGDKVLCLGENCFYDSYLKTVEWGNSLETIGVKCFAKSNLKSVNLPSSLKVIQNRAFQQCSYLEGKVVLPEGLLELHAYAFDWCRLVKEFVVPASLTKIEEHAFGACGSLIRIFIPKEIDYVGTRIVYGFDGEDTGVKVYTDKANSSGWHGRWSGDAGSVFYNVSYEEYLQICETGIDKDAIQEPVEPEAGGEEPVDPGIVDEPEGAEPEGDDPVDPESGEDSGGELNPEEE